MNITAYVWQELPYDDRMFLLEIAVLRTRLRKKGGRNIEVA